MDFYPYMKQKIKNYGNRILFLPKSLKLYVSPSFAIILIGKRELVALLSLFSCDWTISTSNKKCQTRRSCASSFAYWSYKDHTLVSFKTRRATILFWMCKLFTVRHFLHECGDYSHIRKKYFPVDTIKQLFNDVPIDNVFLFLKEINLFNKLYLFSFELFILLTCFQHIIFCAGEHV